MASAVRYVWQGAKVVLALATLIGSALYSAEKIDRSGLNALAVRAMDPPTTGSIAPQKSKRPSER
ncbi:hypothetical protein [Methylobacterium oxalidis]|uniref:Uncharacterized protein n=1 Tax=Methylobacterium oxalidis TaxID=944322 RepID=A0A512J245_9HYPH|nr:hypothetical protein [Methylobacterium oxalidis]GEP04038.1 hypothetical protein MOX02_20760 [Methylobacterium oxalidis]GJE34837.1 hypothetical protein LDDCCGHA_5052 [Methylobacterium oxalidis]GLS64069.1 hypothetical protein GCM10007888_24500 [Methylobacterium oxalidis]